MYLFLWYFSKNGNADIGADNGAKGTAGTFIVRVYKDSRTVAFAVEIIPDVNDHWGAGAQAQFAPLASF